MNSGLSPVNGGIYGTGTVLTHIPDIHQTHLYKALSYSEMYRVHPAVFTVVDKLAQLTARLPLKVYRRTTGGRKEARQNRYAKLLRRPNPHQDHNLFWRAVCAQFDIYGESIVLKMRGDASGLPTELWPLSPPAVRVVPTSLGTVRYEMGEGNRTLRWSGDDIIHFRTFNPDDMLRGLSPLEPLRRTLENEESARQATTSFWSNGARPGTALTHPGVVSEAAAKRLKAQFDDIAAGANKTGKTVVLEEGMKAERMSLTSEEAQYIQTRKLNREEVYAVYHVPPTAAGDLEHATYSNVTENLRSVYRDTVAPRLQTYEAVLEVQLRPEFGEGIYAEFLMDEVLRGDFEARADAYQKAINAGWMTPGEVRELENLPPAEGADQLFVNSTMIPISRAATDPEALPALESGEQPE